MDHFLVGTPLAPLQSTHGPVVGAPLLEAEVQRTVAGRRRIPRKHPALGRERDCEATVLINSIPKPLQPQDFEITRRELKMRIMWRGHGGLNFKTSELR